MGKRPKNPNNKFYTHWGIFAIILLVVVVILISNFSVVSKETTKAVVYDRLMTETVVYADQIGDVFDSATNAGLGAASVMEISGPINDSLKKNIAKNLIGSVNGAYLVAIANNEGHGMTSEGAEVDVSSFEYYYSGTIPKYIYVSDDGIEGREAFVVAVPYSHDGMVAGKIYMFLNPESVLASLPVKGYGGGVAFALFGADGDIIKSAGSTSFTCKEGNLFTNLSTSTLTDLSLSQIKLRAEKQNKMVFGTSMGTEARVISVAPIYVNDWQLSIVMNQRYVESVILNQMGDARKLIIELGVAVSVFLIIIIFIVLVGRLKYGEQNKDLADKADTDLLTGVNNKIATERKIQEYIEENPDSQCLMFLFDIDNFKKINDTMGHAFGDEVLRTLGHQLRNEFRVSDIIGRLGGDEFVLFLKNIKSDEQLEREGVRITNFFKQFKAGDYVKYSATASIGAVVVPRDAHSFEAAYKNADKALYEAKRRGKNQLIFYEDYMVQGTSKE